MRRPVVLSRLVPLSLAAAALGLVPPPAAVVTLGSLLASAAHAQSSAADAKYAADYQRRLLTVDAMRGALVREAKAVRQDVDAVLDRVDEQRRAAESLAGRSDYRGALQAIDVAYAALRDQLTRLKAGQSPNLPSGSAALAAAGEDPGKLRARAEQRVRSARALREALLRFDAKGNAALGDDAEQALVQAETLHAKGDYAASLAAADAAYAAIRAASVAQRDHTEQIASKTFATLREEYAYELGRNDDYARLARGLAEREDVARLGAAPFEQAQSLRRDAERAAASESWGEGVRLLEASTLEFKRVVRAAGFNVP